MEITLIKNKQSNQQIKKQTKIQNIFDTYLVFSVQSDVLHLQAVQEKGGNAQLFKIVLIGPLILA